MEEMMKLGAELLCLSFPAAAPFVGIGEQIKEMFKSIPNMIFCEKLYKILSQAGMNYFEWLKLSGKFGKDNAEYNKNVKQLIYTINAINEESMIDIYANLLRAYSADCISREELFRFGWILTNIYSADLLYLKNCWEKKDSLSECSELRTLEQYDLVVCHVKQRYNSKGDRSYAISELGKKMLSCGIDFDNYDQYKKAWGSK